MTVVDQVMRLARPRTEPSRSPGGRRSHAPAPCPTGRRVLSHAPARARPRRRMPQPPARGRKRSLSGAASRARLSSFRTAGTDGARRTGGRGHCRDPLTNRKLPRRVVDEDGVTTVRSGLDRRYPITGEGESCRASPGVDDVSAAACCAPTAAISTTSARPRIATMPRALGLFVTDARRR